MPELENKLAAPEGCAPLTCSPCPKCEPEAEVSVIMDGHHGQALGSFVRCWGIHPAPCHNGPWINRTADKEADIIAAIEAWNSQANSPDQPPASR